jgi:polyhydroxyalkanoate synthase subunit PhaC
LILHGRTIDQVIDRGQRGSFRKEIVVVPGKVPLAMVRKRCASRAEGSRGGSAQTSGSAGETLAPVLLVHGFGQNRYAWHLPSRSFANHLARAGFDVFNLDLRGHGRSRSMGARRSSGVLDYATYDLPAAVDEIQRLSGQRPVFLVGHSLGGIVSYAAAPTLAGKVAGIVAIGSPYHFTRGSAVLGGLALLAGALSTFGVRVPNAPVFLGPLGVVARPFRRLLESRVSPIPLRGWHPGALEPHVLEEHLRLAFDRASAADLANLFEWAADKRFGGRKSDYAERFERLDRPLLVVAGLADELAPPAGVRAASVRSRSQDKTYRELPLGHIDLLVGRDAPLTTWPLVTGWLTKRAA